MKDTVLRRELASITLATRKTKNFFRGMLSAFSRAGEVGPLQLHWRRGKRRTFFVECCQRLGPVRVSSCVFTNLAAWSYAVFSLRGLE